MFVAPKKIKMESPLLFFNYYIDLFSKEVHYIKKI